MIGLSAFLFFVLWSFISYKLSKVLTKEIKAENSKKIAIPILSALIFFVPVADDIVGGIQFRLLCSKNSGAYVNVENARNKELFEYSIKENVNGYILPTKKYTYFFKDETTQEVVVSWYRYKSSGGWLSRAINFNSSDEPFTFNGFCRPSYSGMDIVKDLNINLRSK